MGGREGRRVGRYARRMGTEWLVFLHLIGAFLFVGGSLVATVLRLAAIRRRAPADVALLLGAVRPAVPVVGLGFVLAVVMGFALVEKIGFDYGATWLSATFALLLWMLVVGAVAGRADRRTRELAERARRGRRPRRGAAPPPRRPGRAGARTARCSRPPSR